MSRLLTIGNIAAFEYPPTVNVEEFDFDNEGVLFIGGYMTPLWAEPIPSCKRFDTKLRGYTLLGKHHQAIAKVKNMPTDLVEAVNLNNTVFFIKPKE